MKKLQGDLLRSKVHCFVAAAKAEPIFSEGHFERLKFQKSFKFCLTGGAKMTYDLISVTSLLEF